MQLPHLHHKEAKPVSTANITPGQNPTTELALLEVLRKERADALAKEIAERGRTPSMCSFILGNYMGCRRLAVTPSTFCARHTVISDMITAGSLKPEDLGFEIVGQQAV